MNVGLCNMGCKNIYFNICWVFIYFFFFKLNKKCEGKIIIINSSFFFFWVGKRLLYIISFLGEIYYIIGEKLFYNV